MEIWGEKQSSKEDNLGKYDYYSFKNKQTKKLQDVYLLRVN